MTDQKQTAQTTDESEYDYLYKVVLCGATGSGKTSLFNTAFAEGKSRFSVEEKHTGELSLHTLNVIAKAAVESKTYINPSEIVTRLQYWDAHDMTSSHRAVLAEYYRGAGAVICCVDASAADWQNQIDTQYKNYSDYTKDASFIVVATKCDTSPNNINAIQEYTREKNIEFFASSAKTGVLLKNRRRYDLQSLPQQIELIIRAKREAKPIAEAKSESASSVSIQEVQVQPEADSSSIAISAVKTPSSSLRVLPPPPPPSPVVEPIETAKPEPEPLKPKILIIGSLSVGFVLLGFASLISYPLNIWSAASVVAPYLFIGGAALFLISALLMSFYGWIGKLWNDHKVVAVCLLVLSALLFTDLGLYDSKFPDLFGEKAALSATLGVFFSGFILLVLNFAYIGVKLWKCTANPDNAEVEEHNVPTEQVNEVLQSARIGSRKTLESIGDEENDGKTLDLTGRALPSQEAWKKHETEVLNRIIL
ncbi:MAG: hypothetical protein M1561_01755 [Gammaproteobacteria bacterium]|nr:hypothetical protein [Gammaproteobacteria bacterium]